MKFAMRCFFALLLLASTQGSPRRQALEILNGAKGLLENTQKLIEQLDLVDEDELKDHRAPRRLQVQNQLQGQCLATQIVDLTDQLANLSARVDSIDALDHACCEQAPGVPQVPVIDYAAVFSSRDVNKFLKIETMQMNTNTFTWEMWMRIDNNSGSEHFFSYADSQDSNALLWRLTEDSQSKWDVYATNDANGSASNTLCDINHPAEGEWFHIAVTQDGDTRKQYMNGVECFNGNQSFGGLGEGRLYLGHDQDSAGNVGAPALDASQALQGAMDDVMLWNTARTMNEIRGDMQGVIGDKRDLQYFWNFNKQDGRDSSGRPDCARHICDLTASNMTWEKLDAAKTDMVADISQTGTKANYAALFSSRDVNKYLMADSIDMNISAFTWEMWMRNDAATDAEHFFSYADASDSNALLWRLLNGQTWDAYEAPVGAGECDIKVIPGEWNHLALVQDGGQRRMYLNGRKCGQKDIAFSRSSPGRFYLGHDQDSTGMVGPPQLDASQALLGAMDEVMLWSVARTADEIKQDMRGQLQAFPSTLSYYWNFDGKDGTDATGNQDLTASNIEWIEVL